MRLRRFSLAAAALLAACGSVDAPAPPDPAAMRGSWVTSAFTQQLATAGGQVSYAAWFHLELGDGVFRLELRHRDTTNGEYVEDLETGTWRLRGDLAEFTTDHRYARALGEPLADPRPAPVDPPVARTYRVRLTDPLLQMTIVNCFDGVRCITGLGELFLREPPHPPAR